MSTPPPAKRPRTSASENSSPPGGFITRELPPPSAIISPPPTTLNTAPPPLLSPLSPISPANPRKRAAPSDEASDTRRPFGVETSTTSLSIPSLLSEDNGKKRSRTNTPWTAAEEQRLKQMRDEGKSWSEIAKAFPNRTEGSVKKHWYKDMHYAEFAEDETKALLEAIKEYEANKWKVIGAKLGKPAKACEQFAREHFKTQ